MFLTIQKNQYFATFPSPALGCDRRTDGTTNQPNDQQTDMRAPPEVKLPVIMSAIDMITSYFQISLKDRELNRENRENHPLFPSSTLCFRGGALGFNSFCNLRGFARGFRGYLCHLHL